MRPVTKTCFHDNRYYRAGEIFQKDACNVSYISNGPRLEKTCLRGFANNTGADRPAHPCSLISAFVVRFWKVLYVNLLQMKFQFSS